LTIFRFVPSKRERNENRPIDGNINDRSEL
jgi:hypothetical protein